MIDNTINDDKTISGGGEDMILSGRYHILRRLGEGGNGPRITLENGII